MTGRSCLAHRASPSRHIHFRVLAGTAGQRSGIPQGEVSKLLACPERARSAGSSAPGAPVRQLHLVGFTSDCEGLILAARPGAKTGSFVVKLEPGLLERLEAARQEATEAAAGPSETPAPPRPRVQSALSPREMQARLRAGRSVAEVAAEAGVEIDWVERFAAPILAEQAAVVARAQQAVLHTPRRGGSSRPLGLSVRRNLADRGILMTDQEFDSAWSAFQLADHEWVVRFRYRSRGGSRQAEWVIDLDRGELRPLGRLGGDLGYVDARRRSGNPEALPAPKRSPARPRSAPARSGDRSAKSRGGRSAAQGAKPAASRSAAALPSKKRRPPLETQPLLKAQRHADNGTTGSRREGRPTSNGSAPSRRKPGERRV